MLPTQDVQFISPGADPPKDLQQVMGLLEVVVELLTDNMTGRGYNREASLAISKAQEARTWTLLSLGTLDPKAAAEYHLNVAINMAIKHGFGELLAAAARAHFNTHFKGES